MAFLDRLQKGMQDVVKGTKEIAEVARQNSLISDEQRRIADLYAQIGKICFETTEADPESPIGKMFLEIKAANERIAGYQDAIRQIKGTKRCPNCGADVPLNVAFCGACGAKVETPADEPVNPEPVSEKRRCSACGAELEDGVMFCTACGQRQEG
ncbi:MAG: zinc ribbon domain-containing protein [Clostridiales bacterium]|jgi:DNA-directed RNA polymerase subunit RPC12/RpoP|nr:zinc ribbon domain-containing protein [Clostridiales bacterium]